MKHVYTLLFLLLTTPVFSQEAPGNNALSVYASPDYSFAANTVQEVRGQGCYSFGAAYSRYVGRKSVISAGITLSSRRIRTNNITFSQNYDSISGSFDTTFFTVVDRGFIQVPLKWSRYLIQNERFGMYISAGLSFNLQFREKTSLTAIPRSGEQVDKYSVISDANSRAFGVNPFIGAGFEFALTDAVHFAIQPEYGFYLLKDADYSIQTLGVGFLINYRF